MKDRGLGTFTLESEKRPFWNDRGLALMAFIIPFAILGITYGALSVFPFGGRHMLTVDLFHQYAPFLALYRQKLLAGSSFFYTTGIGLGVNFYTLFAYYLASPFNLLMLLFPASCLTEGIFLLTLIKIGCAGLTFFQYLRISFRRRGALAVAFSAFYALSGYVLAYSWNIMWLDTLILLPLVLLALIRQIKAGKWLLYPLALALLLVTNYYSGFFACIFIALYYPILLLRYTRDRQPGRRLKRMGMTAGLTVIGVALSAVVLVPVWRSLSITSAAGDRFPSTLDLLGRPLAYFGQFFPFLQPTVRSGSPNLYSGLFVLVLLPVFFISSRIRLREKLLNGFLLLFLFLSFDVNYLNFLWHGMHYPNQLPFRFSFVVILLVLTLAYDGLRSLREFRTAEVGLLGLLITLLIPLVAAIESDIKLAPWTQWGAMAFMVTYAIVFSTFRTRQFKRRFQVNLLIGLMLLELVLSTFSGLYYIDTNEYFGNRDTYSAGETVDSIREAVSQIDRLNEGERFYRVETRPHKTSNDPALYGYRGFSLFASTAPKAPVTFFKDLGFANNGVNSYQYRGATLFTEALVGIRYVINRERTGLDESARRLLLGNDRVSVYENMDAFPFGFLADRRLANFSGSSGDPFSYQNRLASALFRDEGELFDSLSHESLAGGLTASGTSRFSYPQSEAGEGGLWTVSWTAERSGPHYLLLDLKGLETDELGLKVDGISVKADGRKKEIHDLGTVQAGSLIELTLTPAGNPGGNGSFEARLARLDPARLSELANQAQAYALEDLSLKEDHFSGRVRAEEDRLLLVTVPHDPGWTAYLDGRPVPIQTLEGALMAIPVPAGEHEIFFAFLPQGFNLGLMVTLAGLGVLVLLAGLNLLVRIRRKPIKKDGDNPAEGDESVSLTTSEERAAWYDTGQPEENGRKKEGVST